MKIKSLGIALADFVDCKQKPSLDEKLKILFEGKPSEKMQTLRLGGGIVPKVKRYTNITNPQFPIPNCFKLINVYVIQQHHHIHDVICYGELKEDVVEDLRHVLN
jgi:hypothetical protein